MRGASEGGYMKDENDKDRVPTKIRTLELMQEGKRSEKADEVMRGSQMGEVLSYYKVELT